MHFSSQVLLARDASRLAMQSPSLPQSPSSIDHVPSASHFESTLPTLERSPRHEYSPALQLPQNVGLQIDADSHFSTARQDLPSGLHSSRDCPSQRRSPGLHTRHCLPFESQRSALPHVCFKTQPASLPPHVSRYSPLQR